MLDLDFLVAFLGRVNEALKLDQYYVADWLYLAILLTAVLCLYRGHRSGTVDLWDVVRATNKDGKVFTDPRKLFEAGAFVVMTVYFSHAALQGKMTEWYAAIYVGAFVAARYARDREQRLNRQIDLEMSRKNGTTAANGGKSVV